MLTIEPRRMEAYREQRHTSAAAPPGFVFGHRQRAAAEIVAAQALGQEEAIDEQLAAIAAAEQPAEDRAGLGVGDEDGERLVIPRAADRVIVGAETLRDHRLLRFVRGIGQAQ